MPTHRAYVPIGALLLTLTQCTFVKTECDGTDPSCQPTLLLLRPASTALVCRAIDPPTSNRITVTSLADNATSGDGLVTLREAVAAVNGVGNADVAAGTGTETIDLRNLSGTISLTSSLAITSSPSIIGPCPLSLTISGGNTTQNFNLTGAGSVFLANLNITDGKVTGQQGGDGIVAPPNGRSGGGGAAGMGGALFLSGGSLTIDTILFSANTAVGGRGGNAGGIAGGGISGAAGGGPFGGAGGAGNSGVGNGSTGGNGGYGSGGGAGGSSNGVCTPSCGGVGGTGGLYGGGGGGGSSPFGNDGLGPGIGGTFGGNGGNGFASAPSGGGGGAGLGGAIFVRSGTLRITNAVFQGNQTQGGAAGCGGYCPAVEPSMGSAGQGKGGAIFADTGVTYSFTKVQHTGNSAANAGSTATDNNDVYVP